ncbi:hypothetical protein [Kribbella sp. NPDC048915]|uniref:hypothetical protein n=1 Tax=Kribbella sp. NPDC048915 TaxID=3155148 RepID=UPI0033FC9F76
MRRLLLLLMATGWLLTGTARAEVPTDPRITEAVKAWAIEPLYVDPEFSSVVDRAETLKVISDSTVPVFVAVVPYGEWFQEKGDAVLLAGWMAAANDKPGLYVVMDGRRSYGAAHRVDVRVWSWGYQKDKESLSRQLSGFLGEVRETNNRTPEPARTEPTPPPAPEQPEPPKKFTTGMAIRNGLAGALLGLIGGGILGGIVLAVLAFTGRRREGST